MMGSHDFPGFYGKVPVLGDFVSRRLPSTFIRAWDAWIEDSLSTSRDQLDSAWLEVYLTSPIWRFALSTGNCGNDAWAGILMPSVDKVGRYFPLTLAALIRQEEVLPWLFVTAADWFHNLEELALSALENDFDIEAFDRRLMQLVLSSSGPAKNEIFAGDGCVRENEKIAFHIEMGELGRIPDAFIQLSACLLERFLPVYSLWSTVGSERVKPSLLVYRGLPPRTCFAELLTGCRQEGKANDSRTIQALPSKSGLKVSAAIRRPMENVRDAPIRWCSSAQSTVGKVRDVNQDAYLNRPEVALWAVADGMGGHKSGEMASRAVVTALGAIPPSDNLDTLSAGVRRALQKVNADLLAMARGFESGAIIGSTVIALVAAGRRCAALWSGDSRLYRYRSGVLSQVTEDHSLATELSRRGVEMHSSPEGRGIANVLTNAIGAQKELIIDAVTDEVLDGDIYLLCSDGLVRELRPEEIADILSKRGCEKGSEHLIDLALARGARDNVTVVLACACPGEGHFMQDQEGSSR